MEAGLLKVISFIFSIICLICGTLLRKRRKETPKHADTDDLWLHICQLMDEREEWRNPNTTVETLSRAIGTNRIYVAKCIRKHTGLTFNDYLNKKRIDFMVLQLRQDPSQDHKSAIF